MVEASCQLLHWGHHRPLLHHSWFLLQAIRCPREHQSVALNSSFSTHYTPNLIAIQITAASFSQQHPHSWLDSIPAQEKYARNFRFLEAKDQRQRIGGFHQGRTLPTSLRRTAYCTYPACPRYLDPKPGSYTRRLYQSQGTGVWVGSFIGAPGLGVIPSSLPHKYTLGVNLKYQKDLVFYGQKNIFWKQLLPSFLRACQFLIIFDDHNATGSDSMLIIHSQWSMTYVTYINQPILYPTPLLPIEAKFLSKARGSSSPWTCLNKSTCSKTLVR